MLTFQAKKIKDMVDKENELKGNQVTNKKSFGRNNLLIANTCSNYNFMHNVFSYILDFW